MCPRGSFSLTWPLNSASVYCVQRVREQKRNEKDIFLPGIVGRNMRTCVLVREKAAKALGREYYLELRSQR